MKALRRERIKESQSNSRVIYYHEEQEHKQEPKTCTRRPASRSQSPPVNPGSGHGFSVVVQGVNLFFLKPLRGSCALPRAASMAPPMIAARACVARVVGLSAISAAIFVYSTCGNNEKGVSPLHSSSPDSWASRRISPAAGNSRQECQACQQAPPHKNT